MSDNSNPPPAIPRNVRPGPGVRLRNAILAMLDDHGSIEYHGEKPWASITFAGTRHTMRLSFNGQPAIDAADIFVADLPEHEFALPGQLVAEATVISVDSRWLPEPRMIVECEVLVLDDA